MIQQSKRGLPLGDGICCPECKSPNYIVTNSRPTGLGTRKRRLDCRNCPTRWTTIEETREQESQRQNRLEALVSRKLYNMSAKGRRAVLALLEILPDA